MCHILLLSQNSYLFSFHAIDVIRQMKGFTLNIEHQNIPTDSAKPKTEPKLVSSIEVGFALDRISPGMACFRSAFNITKNSFKYSNICSLIRSCQRAGKLLLFLLLFARTKAKCDRTFNRPLTESTIQMMLQFIQ